MVFLDMRSQNGFSLLEIIIAITIIIIFTVLPILAYTSYMKKSRDEKRKSDVAKISQALENYKAEKGTYPPDLQSLVTGGFMPEIPTDPLSGQKVPWDQNQTFGYAFSSPDGTSYSLIAQLENTGSSGGGTGNGVMVASDPNYLTGSFIGSGSGAANGPNVVFTGQVTNGNFTGTFSGPVNGSANGTISGSISAPGLAVTGNVSGSVTGTGSVDANVLSGGTFTGTSSPVTLTGTSGSGSGSITAGGAITGSFSGTGNGAVTSSTISFTGQVSGGVFTGTFSGPVTGSANGSISGSVTAPGLPVTGNASGTVSGICSITGTVSIGNVFNGNVTSCNLAGSGGGSVVIGNPPNPEGVVVPVIQLTLDAQASITPGAPTATGYVAPTGFGTVTLTPSPSNTPTPSNTPLPTNTLTPTVTLTPTPGPPYTYTAQFGSTGSGNGQFNTPEGVLVDTRGYVYVSDYGNNRIQKFNSAGTYVSTVVVSGSADGQTTGPTDIAFSRSTYYSNPNQLYYVDTSNNRINNYGTDVAALDYRWGAVGSGNGQFQNPRGIARDAAGNFYVVDTTNNRVQKFNSVGTYVTKWGAAGSGNSQFNAATDIAVDDSNNLYVTDKGNNRVQKFTTAGVYVSQWGSAGSGNGQFNLPYGIEVDPWGRVVVVDSGNARVQIFTNAGVFVDKFGSAGSGNGQFTTPHDISFNDVGAAFVSDTGNNRVEKFTYTGAVPTAVIVPKIVFRVNGDTNIRTINEDGTNPVTIARHIGANYTVACTGNELVSDPTFSADYKKIVYAWYCNDQNAPFNTIMSHIWIMNADGTNNTQITTGSDTLAKVYPAITADKTKIFFTGKQGSGVNQIYRANIDGSGQVNISNNAFQEYAAYPNPAGTKVAFMTNRSGYFQIQDMNFDGTGARNLTNNTFSESWPSYNKAGTKIVFTSNRDGASQEYVMNIDGTGQTRLATGYSDNRATFNYDGTKVFFESYNRGGDNNDYIYSMNSLTGVSQTAISAPLGSNTYLIGRN